MIKRMSKILSLTVCIILIATTLTSTAFATQSNYDSFDTSSLVITDDPGKDMSAIALAQLGKTGRELNYSEEWCADFVGDCAIITGQSDAVPLYGGVEGLYTRLIDAGAVTVTDTPKPGDLVFINWNSEERKGHIEIVYDFDAETGTVFTVGGNTGDFDSYYERRVGTHEISIDSDVIKEILRPDYFYCTQHNFTIFKCTECGALRPEISSFINQLRAFIYSIKALFDSFSERI